MAFHLVQLHKLPSWALFSLSPWKHYYFLLLKSFVFYCPCSQDPEHCGSIECYLHCWKCSQQCKISGIKNTVLVMHPLYNSITNTWTLLATWSVALSRVETISLENSCIAVRLIIALFSPSRQVEVYPFLCVNYFGQYYVFEIFARITDVHFMFIY